MVRQYYNSNTKSSYRRRKKNNEPTFTDSLSKEELTFLNRIESMQKLQNVDYDDDIPQNELVEQLEESMSLDGDNREVLLNN